MKKIIFFTALLFVVIAIGSACEANCLVASKKDAKEVIENEGYQDVNVRSSSRVFFARCKDGDDTQFKAEATNQNGKRVTVYACCQGTIFRTWTIRH